MTKRDSSNARSPRPGRLPRRAAAPHRAVAIAMVGLVIFTLLAGTMWTMLTGVRSARDNAERSLHSCAGIIAHSAEELLSRGDASGLRRVLSDAAISNGLDEARITLHGAGIIAGRSLADVTVQELPEKWASDPAAGRTPSVERAGGSIGVTYPIRVPDKGDGTLTLRTRINPPLLGDTTFQLGLGAVALVTLGLAFAAFHATRSRLRALGAIRDALHHAADMTPASLTPGALLISDELGEDARAWNRLLEVREGAATIRDIDAAASRLQGAGGGGGDCASAFDALWMGLIVLDSDGRIRAVNGAAAVFLKQQRQDMTTRPFDACVPDQGVVDAVMGIVKGTSRQRATVETTVAGDGKSGEHTVLRFTVRPMRREDAATALVVIEDITQQRVADASRNAFVAQATHELRTPLTNFRLCLEQLVDEGDKDPLVKARCLNMLSTESRRLERTVGDMLSVSEIEAGTFRVNPGEVRVDTLFEELREDFRAQAEDKEITFAFELPPKFPILVGDRDKVSMALHNLVGNALKYTPVGGKVVVRVAEEPGILRVDVADNGIGISDEEQELIFEKFYRSKDARIGSIGGSGIGLALARQVVRLHGGDIRVHSSVDKGSTFTMTLPLRPAGAGSVGIAA